MMKKIMVFMMGFGLLATSGLAVVEAGSFGSTIHGGDKKELQMNAGASEGIAIGGAGTQQDGNLMNVIKGFINWVLGLLGLITFVLLLWGGFNMVTAAGDDKKFGMGQTILKHAAIGLGFIACSWLMVSMIFWVITTVAGGGNGSN